MTPSEQARLSQYDHPAYPGVDNWQDTSLQNGNIIYVWEADGQTSHGDGNAYAMTPNTAIGCNGDPNQLQNDLQTSLDERYDTHRGRLQAYEIKEYVPAAYSHCEANTCHGTGGGEQYFVPNFDDGVMHRKIVRIDDLNLDFNKDMLPISQEQKTTDNEALKAQSPEQSATPSCGTTATLDGAYQGPTPNRADKLKPQVDAAQKEWNEKVSYSQTQTGTTENNIRPETPQVSGGGGARAPDDTSTPNENPIRGTSPEEKQLIELPKDENASLVDPEKTLAANNGAGSLAPSGIM